MNEAPLVTVLIPLYNHERFISETIQSVLNQSFQNFEIVVIDDKSTDRSVEIVRKFNDKRIRIIEHPINLGPCCATNTGIRNSSPSSEFICFFTSDDVMRSDRLEVQVSFLKQNPSYGAVFSQVEMIDERGALLKKKTNRYEKVFIADDYTRKDWLRHFFFRGNCIASPTGMIRKDVLLKVENFFGYLYNPALYQAHDFDMSVRISILGYEMKTLKEKLVKLRKLDKKKNLSSDTDEVRSRLVFENKKIIDHFLRIDLRYFREVFFDSAYLKNLSGDDRDITAALAFEALKVKESFYMRHFAIDALYSIIKDQKDIEYFNKKFALSLRSLAEISSLFFIFDFNQKNQKLFSSGCVRSVFLKLVNGKFLRVIGRLWQK